MSTALARTRQPGITAATRLPADPPTVEYLAERVRLGMPSHAEALAHGCPWCHSAPGEACHVRATGRRLAEVHEARLLLAEATP